MLTNLPYDLNIIDNINVCFTKCLNRFLIVNVNSRGLLPDFETSNFAKVHFQL